MRRFVILGATATVVALAGFAGAASAQGFGDTKGGRDGSANTQPRGAGSGAGQGAGAGQRGGGDAARPARGGGDRGGEVARPGRGGGATAGGLSPRNPDVVEGRRRDGDRGDRGGRETRGRDRDDDRGRDRGFGRPRYGGPIFVPPVTRYVIIDEADVDFDDCPYLKWRAEKTESRYWWRKYRQCRERNY